MLFKVFYTHKCIADRFGAQTYGPFIFIRPQHSMDKGLLEHEKIHVKQFWKNPLFGLWYLFSKKSRMAYEVEAYQEQLKYNPEHLDLYASFLSTKYTLGITKEQAMIALEN